MGLFSRFMEQSSKPVPPPLRMPSNETDEGQQEAAIYEEILQTVAGKSFTDNNERLSPEDNELISRGSHALMFPKSGMTEGLPTRNLAYVYGLLDKHFPDKDEAWKLPAARSLAKHLNTKPAKSQIN